MNLITLTSYLQSDGDNGFPMKLITNLIMMDMCLQEIFYLYKRRYLIQRYKKYSEFHEIIEI